MPTLFHSFLDESGQREYGSPDPYFVVAGTVVRAELSTVYATEFAGLKRAYFGDPDVEIKSNWLRQPKERTKRYLKPYGIKERRLTAFVNALYRWINATDVTFIAAVVDKPQIQAQYSKPYHPSALGYQVFLQRYQNFLASRHSRGNVTWDRMTGASTAGNQWRNLLNLQHAKLKRNGCNFTGLRFSSVEPKLSFEDSKDCVLLQLTDIAAYNTFRQFRDHGKIWDDPKSSDLPVYDYFDRLLPRFRTNAAGVFAGFGVAKMPTRARHQWLI